MPGDGRRQPVGLAHTAFLSADERHLEIEIASCNGDPTAAVDEDAEMVTITVESWLPAGDESDACADGLTVKLGAELGDRQVIHGVTGHPIDVVRRCPSRQGIGREAGEYLGLVEDQAVAQASEAGLYLVVECRDGETFPSPRRTNTQLWISLDGGVVTSAYRI